MTIVPGNAPAPDPTPAPTPASGTPATGDDSLVLTLGGCVFLGGLIAFGAAVIAVRRRKANVAQ